MMVSLPAAAHHSFAIFDQIKTSTATGTVRKVEWTNPHAYIFFDVADAQGKTTKVTLECGSISLLVQKGWKLNSIKAGDTISFAYHPLRSGEPGGMLVSVTLRDGKVLKG